MDAGLLTENVVAETKDPQDKAPLTIAEVPLLEARTELVPIKVRNRSWIPAMGSPLEESYQRSQQ